MVTREDVKALIDSIEILYNPKTMEVLQKRPILKRAMLKKLLPSKSCLASFNHDVGSEANTF